MGAKIDSDEVYRRLGGLTRQLHDTLRELGYDRKLMQAAESIPDARSRLSYVAKLTGEAAERVLTAVEAAKTEQERIVLGAGELRESLRDDPVRTVASGAVMSFLDSVESGAGATDGHLTEIMMAQDFHDLTGQVISRVVTLATELEDQLLKLLVESTPPEQRERAEQGWLNGPVVDAKGRNDVVTGQQQVDDLLESLGF